jgi:acyl-CoA thioesterase-1
MGRPEQAGCRLKGGPLRKFVNVLSAALAVLCLHLAPAGAAPVRVMMLGDSLTAGYGLAPEKALPAQLEAALKQAGLDVRVLNAGVSGDTTAGGLARLDWSLAENPDYVLVGLGANDALRGLDPERAYANLDAILTRLRAKGIKTLLLGMLAPPNLGADYGRRFREIYRRLAEKHRVPLYPFLLDGVAADRQLNQPDGIHPNADGVAIIVERLVPVVRQLIEGKA